MDIEVVAFDVFGTLVDWRSSITRALAVAGGAVGLNADWPAVADAWRSRYYPALARVLRGERAFQPLDVLHAEMLDEVVAEFGLESLDAAARRGLVRAWHQLSPWPDTVPGLSALREQHILTPLSNGGVGLLTRLAKSAALPFDCILSAELAGTYKPDPRVYGLAPAYFDVPPDRVMMVACHPGDLEGAHLAGLRTAFIPRPLEWGPGDRAPAPPDSVDVVAGDLVALAASV
ncbi:MAG TPA: haloacid dehalogenase type II [Streptosporangiaceae bacterium]|nr:haloacid dehalogenase type II [Streptosporangiaceae bacterium]